MRRILKLLIAAVGLAVMAPLSAEEPLIWNGFDLNNPEHVLRLQEDSRWVRELNNKGGEKQKKAFQETLGAMQQKANTAATSAMTEKFKNDPRYKDVIFIHDEFSTPGANTSTKINTDYDVRFGYKDSRGNFIECCRDVAEEAFYKSWSQQTGGPPADADLKAHLHHAEKSRFLVTDQWHKEAPRDFTDQNRKAVSNFTKVKESQTILLHPEDFGRVYHEKADEQFRQARAIKQQLNKNDPPLTPNQRTALEEKMKSHQAEGVMQVKKGIQALDASRASYARQGYEVGKIPDSLRSQMDAVLSFEGTKSDDVDAMMKRLGGGDMADVFNQKVSSQIESLKWAKKNPNLLTKSSALATHLEGRFRGRYVGRRFVGSAVGMLGDVLSIEQALKQADQGSNWFLNFEEGDSEAEKIAKAVAIAAAEILPHGPMDLLNRGFTVDENIKSIIELLVKQGKPISNAEIGVLVVGGAMVETTKRLIVDPVTPIAELTKEIFWDSPRDALDRMKAASNRQASEDLARETHTAALAFQNMIDLGAIEATRISGQGSSRHFSGFVVSAEDSLMLEIAGNPQWDNGLMAKWAIKDAKNKVIVSSEAKAAGDPSSLRLQLASTFLKRLSPGQYTVQVNVSDPVSGRTAYERHKFEIPEYFDISEIHIMRIDENNQPITPTLGQSVASDYVRGDGVMVAIEVQGTASEDYLLEWFVNGELWKSNPSTTPTAAFMKMTMSELGPVKIDVRAIDSDGGSNSFLAFRTMTVNVQSHRAKPFELQLARGAKDGPTLSEPARQGERLFFSAEIPMMGSEKVKVPGGLFWRLFDASGNPVPQADRKYMTNERGGTASKGYEYRIGNLPDGEYTMTLSHYPNNDPSLGYRASKTFSVFVPVAITGIWVTNKKGDTTHHPNLKTGDESFLYVTFDMGKGIDSVHKRLQIKRAGSGEILGGGEGEHYRKGETKAQRAAIGLPRNTFKAGDKLIFETVLTAADQPAVRREVEFYVDRYDFSMYAPTTVTAGEEKMIRFSVPPEFRPPYSFDIRGNGLSVSGFSGSSTKGTIRARSSAFSARGNTTLVAKVTDADGRISPTVSLDISVVPPPPPQPKIIPSTPSPAPSPPTSAPSSKPTGGVANNTSPAPSAVAETADQDNPWEELQDQLIDIQTQYYQDKAAAEAESQRRQDEINATYNNLLPPPPPSPWMSGSSNTGSSCTCGINSALTPPLNLSRSPAGGYTPGQSYSIVYVCCGRNETHTAVIDNKGFPRINGQDSSDFLSARRKQCGC